MSSNGFAEGRAPYSAAVSPGRWPAHTRPELLRRTTIDEFEAFLATVERAERYEWVRGWIVQQQAGGTRRHGRIASRIIDLLRGQLDPAAWEIFFEFAVETAESYRFADVLVEAAGAEDSGRKTSSPVLVIEILSETSGDRDRIEKPAEYGAIPSLQAHIVADQFSRHCYAFVRGADGAFPDDPKVLGDTDTITVPGLRISLAIADIYRGIIDPPERDRTDA